MPPNDEGRPLERPRHHHHPAAKGITVRRALEVIQGALSRTVVIREALEDGDVGYAAHVAEDLEHDLSGDLCRLREAA